MGKVILEMDEPRVCIDCPCHFTDDTEIWCGKEKKQLITEDITVYKPDWCPLKKIIIPVDSKYMGFLKSILLGIRYELDRAYWNKNQKEMASPFDNTGESYANETFSISAYNWNEEDGDDIKPNFQYKGFQLWWYKHMGRGMNAVCDEVVDAEYLFKMHEDCMIALQKDFGKYF